MREFCDNSWLSGCSQSNGIENNQAAMNCMEMTSFQYRMYIAVDDSYRAKCDLFI